MFYTKEELMVMPLKRLKMIDVFDKDNENLLQEVISLKEKNVIPDIPIKKNDIPDIKTPEEESGWQKVVDLRTEAIKPISVEEVIDLLKCSKCEFTAKSAFGLRVHNKKKHAKT